jgi:hypothetical protein
MKIFIAFLIAFFLCSDSYSQYDRTKVTPHLESYILSKPDFEYVRVFINLKDQLDLDQFNFEMNNASASLELRYKTLVDRLREKSNVTQSPLLSYISSRKNSNGVLEFDAYWISNCIWVNADIRTIKELTLRDDVGLIEIDYPIEFEESVIFPASDNPESVETGLKVIKADKLWKLGYTGQGRIVMNIDSGVDGNHPALNYKWRGLEVPWYHAWMDANGSSFPSWCSSHGSHTMGTMLGRGPATGDTVGVCPDAKWIAAKRSCSGNYSTFAITVFQWAMDPDSNSSTMDQPDVINCSWTTTDPTGSQCAGTYKTTLLTLEAAGIAVVWSAGNSGPGASTITSPKNINSNLVNIFSVGALDGNNPSYPIASFSSRGPSNCGGTGSLLIKPEVSAPGVNVRSSVLNNAYGNSSGTSMASPHAAGSVALLKSFSPNLTAYQILLGLYFSAVDLGTPGEDNTFGMGLINVFDAMIMLGPQINHTPLNDTLNTSGPYTVRAEISPSDITDGKIDTTKIKLFWGRGTISDSISMQRDTGNVWYANIPGNNQPAAYKYYINVTDTIGTRGNSPGDAPVEVHTFNAGLVSINTESELPFEFNLFQNYPNPFNPVTVIKYSIPVKQKVQLVILDILGREIKTLENEIKNAGQHEITFNGKDLSSGVYFYKLITANYIQTRAMILLK